MIRNIRGMLSYSYRAADLKIAGSKSSKSHFDDMLCKTWSEAMEAGLFRYDLSGTRTRLLDGPHKYVALLNEKRATDRRPPEPMQSVNQPFNGAKFNFNKVQPHEILFNIENKDLPKSSNDRVIINVSPLDFGHSLIVPECDKNLNQNLTAYSLKLALEIMCLSSSSSFRMGFNSLCAHASVNHLHLHCYYSEQSLLADLVAATPLGNHIHRLCNDAPSGYGFELTDVEFIPQVVRSVFTCTDYMKSSNVAYCLFVCRGPSFTDSSVPAVRVLLWPRVKILGPKPSEAAFNTAVIEMAGHLLIKDKSYYDTITDESAYACLKDCSLPDDEFDTLTAELIELLNSASSVTA